MTLQEMEIVTSGRDLFFRDEDGVKQHITEVVSLGIGLIDITYENGTKKTQIIFKDIYYV